MKICFLGDAGHINLISWIKKIVEVYPLNNYFLFTFNDPVENVHGVKIFKLNSPKYFKKLRYIVGISEFKRKVSNLKPDILIAYRINSYGFMLARSGRKPAIVIAQGSDIYYPKKSTIQNFILSYVVRKADVVHVWADHMKTRILTFTQDERKIFVLPKGIDLKIFNSTFEKRKDKVIRLVTNRQLRKSYNHEIVLKAISQVIKKITNIQYIICGDGESRNYLERIVNNLGIQEYVKFYGHIKHKDLPKILKSCDIYISMQPSDGVSASLLEAMASGLLPIVFDNDSNKNWIKDEINGFLVSRLDVTLIKNTILKAINSPLLDEDTKKQNFKIVEKRASIYNNIQKTFKYYSSLIPGYHS
jgi:glycosyltransferase involved in cell wall biosynthesis